MLYMPWRNEATDILGGYATFHSRYEDNRKDILVVEQQYSKNASIIGDAMDDLNEHGPPEHVWNMVAPGAAEQQARDRDEGVEVERDIDQEELDANTILVEQQYSVPLLQRFSMETSRDLLSPEEYHAAIRGLNTKQRQLVMYQRSWCKHVVNQLYLITCLSVDQEELGKIMSFPLSELINDTVELL